MTKTYRVAGPGGDWTIWDFGDEMTVHEGSALTDRVVARVPPKIARKMDAGHRWRHVVSAASSIHVAKLLGTDNPLFHLLWR